MLRARWECRSWTWGPTEVSTEAERRAMVPQLHLPCVEGIVP